MAVYDFGNVILNAMHAEDELNLRREQINQAQQNFLANYGLSLGRLKSEQDRLNLEHNKFNYEQNKPIISSNQYGATITNPQTGEVTYKPTGQLNPTISKNIESGFMRTSDIPQEQLKLFPQSGWLTGDYVNKTVGNNQQYVNPKDTFIPKSAYDAQLKAIGINQRQQSIDQQKQNIQSEIVKRNFDMRTSKTEKENKKVADYQDKYNAFMNSWVKSDDIPDSIMQNASEDLKNEITNKGGAYVVYKGAKPQVFTNSVDLAKWAGQQVPQAPKKWTRDEKGNVIDNVQDYLKSQKSDKPSAY